MFISYIRRHCKPILCVLFVSITIFFKQVLAQPNSNFNGVPPLANLGMELNNIGFYDPQTELISTCVGLQGLISAQRQTFNRFIL